VFNLAIPWWEFIVRGIVVYVFLLILLRITGKRQVGQLAPFDLVLLLGSGGTMRPPTFPVAPSTIAEYCAFASPTWDRLHSV
jgi:uncharacterized membrane protein YcaP (DUF421 family)